MESTGSRRLIQWAVFLGWTSIVLARTGWRASFDTIWAEDGLIFLEQARGEGIGALFRPYNGYLHLVPRLAVMPIAELPLAFAAGSMSVMAALIAAGCAGIIWQTSRSRLPAATSFALATYSILLPTAGVELLGNLTYLQWSMLAASAWVLLVRSPGRAAWWGAAFLFATCLSAPQAIVLLPLALVQAARQPKAGLLPAGGLLLGLALQWGFISASLGVGNAHGFASISAILGPAMESFFGRVVLGTVLGDVFNAHFSSLLDSGTYLALAQGTTGFLTLAFVWFARRLRSDALEPALWLVAMSIGLFAFCVIARDTIPGPGFFGARYVATSGFFLASAGALALVHGTRGIRWPVAVAFGTAVLACAVSFSTPGVLRQDPSWNQGLDAAQEQCEGMRGDLFLIDGVAVEPVVSIPISPVGWSFQIKCSDLDPGWFGPT